MADELLNELGMEFLLNGHESSRPYPSLPILVQSELRAE